MRDEKKNLQEQWNIIVQKWKIQKNITFKETPTTKSEENDKTLGHNKDKIIKLKSG